ncbi:hypothetical protein FG93_01106 [Bosea sp. LC85]|uniref:hypothetical protein n=1 Tax=Bosea sp. LC85 TaxID=1502851 RepID=UPI0004E3892B|nr:hypothetical protein [Bosea sp. LC85]KFC74520.1 hypothetical protein FG93_01106 [Bosea sp. LC85]
MTQTTNLHEIANLVAASLAKASPRGESAVIATPVLAYGHTFVPVHISPHRNGTLVSDGGFAKREAALLGGDNLFSAQARRAAAHYGVQCDGDIFFALEREAEIDALTSAVASVANASKSTIEGVMHRMVETHVDANRDLVLRSIIASFHHTQVLTGSKAKLHGAREQWDFDVVVQTPQRTLAVDIISPHSGSVTSAFAKFSDIRDRANAPRGVGVLLDKEKTPRLKLITDVASLVPLEAVSEQQWRHLARAA